MAKSWQQTGKLMYIKILWECNMTNAQMHITVKERVLFSN